MKKLYISILVFIAFVVNAQNNLYNKSQAFLTNQTKEVVANRLIAINVWSASDKNSRDLNLEFDKAYNTFEYAKLKGGNKGIIVINVCIDEDVVNSNITLKKDGITKLNRLPADNVDIREELKNKSAGYNIVFDSNGNVVYENLAKGTVFNFIQQLITR